ncbi:MAG: RGCVC family protein [Blastococcus sp.]
MTSAPSTTSPTTDRDAPGAVELAGRCPACPHPLADHDAISLRYCAASKAIAAARGCVCPKR